MTAPRRMAWMVVTLLFATSPSARAADDQSAAEWKRRGDQAMDAGRAAEALAAYRHAAAIEPSPALEYNVGRALLAVGDFAGALEAFEHYEATAPDDLKKRTHRLAEIMTELRGKVATLAVVSDEPSDSGAHVKVRGVDAGVLPLPALRVNPGRAEVRVEREGFEPLVESIDLRGGEESRIRVVLRPERVVAHLTIVATPASARVFVDGKGRGATPLDLDLAPGVHRVVLSAPKHLDRDLSVNLSRSDSRRIDVQLTRESLPLTSRWWFWAGAGMLVAGATVAVVAARVERSPAEGSLGTFHAP